MKKEKMAALPYLSDERKEMLRSTHEWLDNNVQGWSLLLQEQTNFSIVTISRTMNCYKSGHKPNYKVLAAVKELYLQKKEEIEASFDFVAPTSQMASSAPTSGAVGI